MIIYRIQRRENAEMQKYKNAKIEIIMVFSSILYFPFSTEFKARRHLRNQNRLLTVIIQMMEK